MYPTGTRQYNQRRHDAFSALFIRVDKTDRPHIMCRRSLGTFFFFFFKHSNSKHASRRTNALLNNYHVLRSGELSVSLSRKENFTSNQVSLYKQPTRQPNESLKTNEKNSEGRALHRTQQKLFRTQSHTPQITTTTLQQIR